LFTLDNESPVVDRKFPFLCQQSPGSPSSSTCFLAALFTTPPPQEQYGPEHCGTAVLLSGSDRRCPAYVPPAPQFGLYPQAPFPHHFRLPFSFFHRPPSSILLMAQSRGGRHSAFNASGQHPFLELHPSSPLHLATRLILRVSNRHAW